MECDNIDHFQFKSNLVIIDDEEDDELPFDENWDDMDIFNDCEATIEDEPLDMESLDPNSNFTYVIDESGEQRMIRKSTLVWMLTEPGISISKDRLRRVQISKKRKLPIE